ncbi:hypothetical protein BKA67DRAFT_529994 [Truncatella angustata]|uniref:Secreted protein n=1 Tax=Truncatella angustata TaxID=152316 RepID=A0A9P8UX97_9PEZI|nr:uncharacterized protein BKA67DRAFT_529994 [Truncatella angustata]KAH6659865.1 hypothetical protein BKA67DRAFT_529994 [Truncatella angustata]
MLHYLLLVLVLMLVLVLVLVQFVLCDSCCAPRRRRGPSLVCDAIFFPELNPTMYSCSSGQTPTFQIFKHLPTLMCLRQIAYACNEAGVASSELPSTELFGP